MEDIFQWEACGMIMRVLAVTKKKWMVNISVYACMKIKERIKDTHQTVNIDYHGVGN